MKTHTSGYGIGQVQYELLSCTTNETPLQRYYCFSYKVTTNSSCYASWVWIGFDPFKYFHQIAATKHESRTLKFKTNFRYQRLKLEISEFSADLEKLKTEDAENTNNVKLAEEVCYFYQAASLILLQTILCYKVLAR